jgi:hypothetical protein
MPAKDQPQDEEADKFLYYILDLLPTVVLEVMASIHS